MQPVITLVQALVWPVVIVALLLYFGRPLKRLLEQAAELSLKAGGVEAKLTRASVVAAAEAAAALGVAATKQAPDKLHEAPSIEPDVERIAVSVTNAVTAREAGRLSRRKILWADDRPSNNTFEQNALTSLGFDIETAVSTEEALAKTRRQRYDVIISDMGRPGDDRAGYTLLRELRSAGTEVPFIIYAGSNAPEHRAEARRNGAFGTTNNPGELVQLVTHAAQRQPR